MAKKLVSLGSKVISLSLPIVASETNFLNLSSGYHNKKRYGAVYFFLNCVKLYDYSLLKKDEMAKNDTTYAEKLQSWFSVGGEFVVALVGYSWGKIIENLYFCKCPKRGL